MMTMTNGKTIMYLYDFNYFILEKGKAVAYSGSTSRCFFFVLEKGLKTGCKG